jgi:hypothetical protein
MVYEKGKMVVVLSFPVFDCLLSDVLLPENLSGHVVRGVDVKKQKKDYYIYAKYYRYGVTTTPDDVGNHKTLISLMTDVL